MSVTLTIRMRYPVEPRVENLQRVMGRVMAARGWPAPVFAANAPGAPVEFACEPDLPAEGYRIATGPDGAVRVSAPDVRGLWYGAGRFLRESGTGPDGAFRPCAWRGTSAPRLGMRGIYFATHFHNFYQDAPVDEVARYIEDLALWGYNALMVWFDLHHFESIRDPAAQAMLARLDALIAVARGAGMSGGIGVLANEGYKSTPAKLRARPTGRAHYGCEVCTATAEGESLALRNLTEEFEAFRKTGLDHLWLWPYDQGGCACELCGPWGANGMLRIGEKVARAFRDRFPGGKIIFSTWLFDYGRDQGEWEGLARAFANGPCWADYLMADSHGRFPRHPLEKGVPGGLPLLNFPEISMYGMSPWGGFGANPLIRRFTGLWGEVAHLADGGFPYSEGIFEDLNKTAYAYFYWTGANDSRPALEQYYRYEFGLDEPALFHRILEILEQNHGPIWLTAAMVKKWGAPKAARPLAGHPGALRMDRPVADAEAASEAVRLCAEAESRMPEWARRNWRWRLVRARAWLDREIMGNGGDPTPACEPVFRELLDLYWAANAEASVAPPGMGENRVDTSSAASD